MITIYKVILIGCRLVIIAVISFLKLSPFFKWQWLCPIEHSKEGDENRINNILLYWSLAMLDLRIITFIIGEYQRYCDVIPVFYVWFYLICIFNFYFISFYFILYFANERKFTWQVECHTLSFLTTINTSKLCNQCISLLLYKKNAQWNHSWIIIRIDMIKLLIIAFEYLLFSIIIQWKSAK